MARLMQYVGTVIIANLCMVMGIMFTWPSSTITLFSSANTTLHRPMTDPEIALLGSLSSVGALIATPAVGMCMDRLGRKKTSIFSCLMGVISWAMVTCSSRVEVVLTAMFVSGLSGSVFVIVPVYISEICEENIRGAMTSGTMIFYGVGMLLSYLLGGYLPYSTMIYVSLLLTVVCTGLLFILKESPTCLMMKGMEKEAAIAIAFYRGLKSDAKEVQNELNTIRRSLNPELDDTTPEEEKQLKPEKQSKQKMGLWTFLKKSSSTRAAFYIVLVLITAQVFQGLVVVQVYAEPLFSEAIPSMPASIASMILAIVIIVAGFIAAYLTELCGRRALIIYATFGAAASCLFIGLQMHLKWGPNWLIAVNIYLFAIMFTFGSGTVPFVLLAELFLPEIKSIMSMAVIEWAWFCGFIVLFIFNPLVKAMGLGPVFYLFSAVSVITGIYCVWKVPETKGLTIDAIQAKLTKKKKRLDVVY